MTFPPYLRKKPAIPFAAVKVVDTFSAHHNSSELTLRFLCIEWIILRHLPGCPLEHGPSPIQHSSHLYSTMQLPAPSTILAAGKGGAGGGGMRPEAALHTAYAAGEGGLRCSSACGWLGLYAQASYAKAGPEMRKTCEAPLCWFRSKMRRFPGRQSPL